MRRSGGRWNLFHKPGIQLLVRQRLAIHEHLIVQQFNPVARQTDHPLHHPRPIRRREEHDHIAALRIALLRKPNPRKGDLQIIGQFVHKHPVALNDRRLHRTGRHIVPVRDGRTE